MKCTANLMAAMALLLVSLGAQAELIINQDVEDDGDWNDTNLFPSAQWNDDGFGFLTPGHQEGLVAAVFQNNDSIQSLSTAFSSFALQEGTYTLEFALGNYSNFPFPAVQIDFAGLTLGDASAVISSACASMNWTPPNPLTCRSTKPGTATPKGLRPTGSPTASTTPAAR